MRTQLNLGYKSFAVVIFAAAVNAAIPFAFAADSADDIARKNHAVGKVVGAVSEAEFRLISANGQERVRQTSGKSKLKADSQDNRSIVTFLSPADVKGTMTLTIE
ncbi:MAG: hypothetical protein OEW08_08810, partial [Gammaproteobacteria bacterium]|nr:hypothetical protein [Gammaproteobacteria bacterium]